MEQIVEQTLSIIKPDAVAKNVVGQILARFEAANLRIAATKKIQLSKADAEEFYAIHAERPFFKDLVEFMISGPVVVTVLEGENAMQRPNGCYKPCRSRGWNYQS